MAGMELVCGVPGQLAVRCVDVSADLATWIRTELDAVSPVDDVRGRVTIRAAPAGSRLERPRREQINGDAGDGVVVGQADGELVIDDAGGWTSIAGPPEDVQITMGPTTDRWRVMQDLLRPALQIAGIEHGTSVAHAAGVRIADRGVLLTGWSESGKTEIALALVERGAEFLGDKWMVWWTPQPAAATDGEALIAPFPNRVGVRGWVVPYLPTIEARLRRGQRLRLRFGGLAAASARGLGRAGRRNRLTDAVLGPIGAAGSLADTIRLTRHDIGQDGPGALPPQAKLGAVILLETIEQGEAASLDVVEPAPVAAAMARSAAFERRRYHLLGERTAGFRPHPIPGFEIVAREAAAYERLIARTPVYRVRAPFPGDPRIAADLILRAL